MSKVPKILIIEDERPLRNALELKFQGEGIQVQTLTNGENAMDYIETGEFSLIILDIVMPKANGYKVLEDMRNENIDLPVVIVSNLSQPNDIQKSKSLGALEYFIKSDTPIVDLVQYVKKQLGE